MAYQIRRKKKASEQLELLDESGNIVHVIEVNLDTGNIVQKIYRKYSELTRVLAEVREIDRNVAVKEELNGSLEKLGNAVVVLIEAVFGEEDTEKILDFYHADYVGMCTDIVPFIRIVVVPEMLKIQRESRKTVRAAYNRKGIFKK